MDVDRSCLDACRARFGEWQASRVLFYHLNDGLTLPSARRIEKPSDSRAGITLVDQFGSVEVALRGARQLALSAKSLHAARAASLRRRSGPCGYAEWQEDVRATAAREALEEAGLVVEIGEIVQLTT